ncbi:hypothetical protein SEPCBS119000_004058 [Sporothrix epigloea]|uniref:FAD-dependent oxidoreductase-like enzyme n=1 Tax=Sporothrix epigloea TaxID=1892477 RepID=A0ABP0DPZ6_9PEZI
MSTGKEPTTLSRTLSDGPNPIAHPITDINMADERAGILHNSVEVPSTPLGADLAEGGETAILASQETILSTEGPGSPIDGRDSFRAELNDDDNIDIEAELPRSIVPSSLTPPPSSQVHQTLPSSQRHLPLYSLNGNNRSSVSQHSAILSPPGTGPGTAAQARRDVAAAASCASTEAFTATAGAGGSQLCHETSDFVSPTPMQIVDASPDELRAMLQASLVEHTRLKTEAAHHKLQYNLVAMQADEDAKRAAVEHEMTRREIEALCAADSARRARRELSTTTATENSQAKYRQLKAWYDEAAEENESLQKRVKLAKRVIQQKEEEVASLVDEKELLLNRLRENREHFRLLCSPGGLFHGVMTPKPQGSPAHTRITPYQTPKRSSGTGSKLDTVVGNPPTAHHNSAEPLAALLRALNQENNSTPNTPSNSLRAPQRNVARHTRNAQSMSSLPTTPASRARGYGTDYAGLLPSVDLVPQTEAPSLRFPGGDSRHNHNNSQRRGHGHSHSVSHMTNAGGRYFPETPTHSRQPLPGGRHSRESTISIDDDVTPQGLDAGRDETAQSYTYTLTENEDIARQALESVARSGALTSATSTTRSLPPPPFSHPSPAPGRQRLEPLGSSVNTDEYSAEDRDGQAALAMLRRDLSSISDAAAMPAASRDVTTAPPAASSSTTEMAARLQSKLQSKLIGALSKASSSAGAADKRKFSGGESQARQSGSDHAVVDGQKHDSHHMQTSPTKKVRIVPSLRDNGDSYRHDYQQHQSYHDQDRIGLGIRYE